MWGVRTTLDLDDRVLEELRHLQRREGGTLGSLVSRLLAEALSTRARLEPKPAFAWTARPMGLLVDLEDKNALQELLDHAGDDREGPSGTT